MAEFNADGVDKLVLLLTGHARQRLDRVEKVMAESAAAGVVVLTNAAPKGATKHLKQSFHISPDGKSVVASAPYAAAVEVGARPHWPNIQALEDWLSSKASELGLADEEIKHVAFLIARKISVDGIEPTWFVRNSIPRLRKIVARLMETRLKEP